MTCCIETQNGWAASMFKCYWTFKHLFFPCCFWFNTSSSPVVLNLTQESYNSATIATQRNSCWGTLCSLGLPLVTSSGAFQCIHFTGNSASEPGLFCNGNPWKYHLNIERISSSSRKKTPLINPLARFGVFDLQHTSLYLHVVSYSLPAFKGFLYKCEIRLDSRTSLWTELLVSNTCVYYLNNGCLKRKWRYFFSYMCIICLCFRALEFISGSLTNASGKCKVRLLCKLRKYSCFLLFMTTITGNCWFYVCWI